MSAPWSVSIFSLRSVRGIGASHPGRSGCCRVDGWSISFTTPVVNYLGSENQQIILGGLPRSKKPDRKAGLKKSG